MSVKIRLTRTGRKKQPHYRIVVMDSRDRRDGAYIDQIGIYQPKQQPAMLKLEEKKALEWLGRGAVPSDTVRNLLAHRGVMLRFDMMKRNYTPDKIDEAVAKWQADAQAREVQRSQTRAQRRKAKQAEAVPSA